MEKRLAYALTAILLSILLTGVATLRRTLAAEGEKPVYEEQYIFEEITGYPSCHGSTIVELPNGELLAAWYAGAFEKSNDVAIFASRLRKGSSKWSEPEIIQDHPGLSEGNPVLFAAPDGTLWHFYQTMYGDTWNDCEVLARVSQDNGHAWGEERTIRKKHGWMTRNKPLVLSDGRWLLPMYDEKLYISTFYITADNGATWENWGRIMPFQNHQPTVIERSDGSLYCIMRTGVSAPNGFLWESVSNNKGKTWKTARMTNIPNPDSAADMAKLANGHVVLALNPTYSSRHPLSVALSEDEGRTWPVLRNIETDPDEFSYPAIIQSSDGMIHVTYTWKRERIKHVAFNEAWLREGGESGWIEKIKP